MSVILARIFSLYFITIGVAFLLKPERFKKMSHHFMKDENFLLLGGIFALFIGAVIVSVHNLWVLGWPLIITLLGWWSLLKGFVLLAYPDTFKGLAFLGDQSDLFYRNISFIYIAIGLFLAYKGWWLQEGFIS